MLPGPVFEIELLAIARRRRYYVLRVVYGAVLICLILFMNPGLDTGAGLDLRLSARQAASLGRAIFEAFSLTQAIVLLTITPALVAGAIAGEKRRGTLDDLLASRLSCAEIVLGLLAARLVHVFAYLGMGLPVLALLTFAGGIDPNQVLLVYAVHASMTVSLACYSLVVSLYARRQQGAVIFVYGSELIWVCGAGALRAVISRTGGVVAGTFGRIDPLVAWLEALSPFDVLTGRPSGGAGGMAPVIWTTALQLAFGAACAAWAVARLRPLSLSGALVGRRASGASLRGLGRWAPRPACGQDPIFWKERFVSRTSPMTRLGLAALTASVVGPLAYTTYGFAERSIVEIESRGFGAAAYTAVAFELNGYLRFVVTLTFTCWLLGLAGAASGCFSGEREGETWDSLMAAPLDPWEVVRGKMFGAVWATRWLALVWVAFVLTGLLLGAVHPVGAVAATVVTAVDLWFACALGCFFSLRSRSSARSLAATIASLLFCNGLYLVAVLPFRVEGLIVLAGVTPFAEAAALLDYDDVQSILTGSAGKMRAFEGIDVIATCVASSLLYLTAALALTYDSVAGFDRLNDRPEPSRRGRGTPRDLIPGPDWEPTGPDPVSPVLARHDDG